MKRTFDYTGRELIVSSAVLSSIVADVITVPATKYLLARSATTQKVYTSAGETLATQIDQLRHEYISFEIGMAVSTDAGDLRVAAIIHAIDHPVVESPEKSLIELSYTNSLKVAEFNQWQTIAFAPLYQGDSIITATAAARAIIRFWDARISSTVETVTLAVAEEHYDTYIAAINTANTGPVDTTRVIEMPNGYDSPEQTRTQGDIADIVEFDVSQEAPVELSNDKAISDWFKNKRHKSIMLLAIN